MRRLPILIALSLLPGPLRAEPRASAPPGLPGAQHDLVRRTYRVLPGQPTYLAATVGVVVVDNSDPSRPTYRGALSLPDSVNDLARVKDRLVAAIGPSGIAVIDTGRPASPRLLARLKLAGAAMGLAARGDLLLVASGSAGLQIVDLSTPTKPRKVAHLDTAGYSRAVRVSGPSVYLADGPRGVKILRLEGQRLAPVADLPTRGHVFDVDLEGRHLLVAEGHAGLARYDVSDPRRPRLVDRLPVEDTARGVDGLGQRVAVADGTKGVLLVDGAKKLRVMDRFTPERAVNAVVLEKDRVLVANDYDGLLTLSISKEGKLGRVGSLPPAGK